MSVSNVGATSPTPVPVTPSPVAQAPNGDYLVRNSKTSQTKDSDGDYQPLPKPPAATSSNGVLVALNNLKPGG